MGGHDAYVVVPVDCEQSCGPAIGSVLLTANVRASDPRTGRGAAQSAGRTVRRECGASDLRVAYYARTSWLLRKPGEWNVPSRTLALIPLLARRVRTFGDRMTG